MSSALLVGDHYKVIEESRHPCTSNELLTQLPLYTKYIAQCRVRLLGPESILQGGKYIQ